MVLTREKRHFESSVRRILGTNKESEAESADRENPGRGGIAAPMADEPTEDDGDEPNATNPHKVMPHGRVTKEMSPAPGPDCWGSFQIMLNMGLTARDAAP